jgi:DNA-binding transcriptional LysR family regulator
MDKLKAIQVFVRIVDTGSLTGAAKSLDSSLPAVVRSLAALEAHLQVRLLNRTTRSIALTAEGDQYLLRCRQLLSAVEEAEDALAEQMTEPSGLLRVTAPVQFGQMYVVPAAINFMKRYKKLRCDVQLHDRVINLIDDSFDLGVRIGELADSTLIAQTLGSTRRVVVASAHYLKQHNMPLLPQDLLRANCIGSPNAGHHSWRFQVNGRQIQVAVSGTMQFNLVGSAVQACVEGVGIGMFMEYQVAPLLRDESLVVLLEKFELPPHPVSVVYPQASFLPLRTKLFVQWLKDELKPTFV